MSSSIIIVSEKDERLPIDRPP